MAAQKSWFDQMVSSRAKAKSPEAEAQRRHDVKAVAAMRKKLGKVKPTGKVADLTETGQSPAIRRGDAAHPGSPHWFGVSQCAEGHKCPDLF